jgi:hypothetical protein
MKYLDMMIEIQQLTSALGISLIGPEAVQDVRSKRGLPAELMPANSKIPFAPQHPSLPLQAH